MYNSSYKIWVYSALLLVTVIFHTSVYYTFYKKVLKAEMLWHAMSINRLRLMASGKSAGGPPMTKTSTVLGLENNELVMPNVARNSGAQSTGSLEVRKVSANQIKVGDIVMIKAGTVAPADVLIIDTSASLHSEKIFHVSERKVTGDSAMIAKFAVRNLNEDSEIKAENINPGLDQLALEIKETETRAKLPKQGSAKVLKEAEKMIKKMTGQIEYDAPNPRSEFAGTFKLRSDHKISRFGKENVMFCGTKLHTGWVIGMVIYSGINTKIMQKNISDFKWWQILNLTKRSSAEKMIDNISWVLLAAGFLYALSVSLISASSGLSAFFNTIGRVHQFPTCQGATCNFSGFLVTLSFCLEIVPIGLPLAKDLVCAYYCLDSEQFFFRISKYIANKLKHSNCIRRMCPRKSNQSKSQTQHIRDWTGANSEYRGPMGAALSRNNLLRLRGGAPQQSNPPFTSVRGQNGQKLFRATSISHRKDEHSESDMNWFAFNSSSQRQFKFRGQPSMIMSQAPGQSTFISPDYAGEDIQSTPLPLDSASHAAYKKFKMPSLEDIRHPSAISPGSQVNLVAGSNTSVDSEESEEGALEQENIKIVRFNLISELGHLDHVIFDKTDTLTTGVFNVAKISTASRGYLLEAHTLAEKMNEARAPGNQLLIQNESVDEVENMHNSGYSEKSQE